MKARAYVMIDTTTFQYLTNEELGKGVFKVTGQSGESFVMIPYNTAVEILQNIGMLNYAPFNVESTAQAISTFLGEHSNLDLDALFKVAMKVRRERAAYKQSQLDYEKLQLKLNRSKFIDLDAE